MPNRHLNNVWAVNRHFDPAKPTLLLNSHHDTVKPNPQYTKDPFDPLVDGGRLYGLGSNDAGGCLVSLLGAFLHLYERRDLAYNLPGRDHRGGRKYRGTTGWKPCCRCYPQSLRGSWESRQR